MASLSWDKFSNIICLKLKWHRLRKMETRLVSSLIVTYSCMLISNWVS